MPVSETLVLRISCDNPDCPGNELDPKDRTGWIFISSEVYGQTMNPQQVYCSPECAAHISQVVSEPPEPAPTMVSNDLEPPPSVLVPPDPKPE